MKHVYFTLALWLGLLASVHAQVPELVAEINAGRQGSSFGGFTPLQNKLYFRAYKAHFGYEVFVTDGTEAGTKMLKDIYPGDNNTSVPVIYGAFNNQVYFSADDNVHGRELWVTDGTEAGTRMLKDINVGSGSTVASDLTLWNGKVYFGANNGTHGKELWVTDGTEAGTKMIQDINVGIEDADPRGFVVYNNQLYFSAKTSVHGTELFTYDGTTVSLVKDINSGTASSLAYQFFEYKNKLYFRATDGVHGRELWVTDGTEAGTQMVQDINSGTADANINDFTIYKDKLYFVANDGVHGNELWSSDGTTLALVKDINPGTEDGLTSYSKVMIVASDKLYLVANDGVHGKELWMTDGTEAGTSLLKDIRAGSTESQIADLVVYNQRLYFRAWSVDEGRELWEVEGTNLRVLDIYPGSEWNSANDGYPAGMTEFNGSLYFGATTLEAGRELWRYTTTAPMTNLYALNSPAVTCQDDVFCVQLSAKASVNDGIIGMDYCLQYDANLMEPTGKVTLGDVVNHSDNAYGAYQLNTNTSGKLHTSIYYNGNAPTGTFFNGVGEVICIEFRLKAGTTLTKGDLVSCEIVESYTLKSVQQTADAGEVTVDANAQKRKGQLLYWNQTGGVRPLAYDAANPQANVLTNIYSNNSAGTALSTQALQPDANGIFVFNPANGSHLSIQRNVPANAPNLMQVVNGMDCYYAALITTFDTQDNGKQWVPNAYQMLAADVNMNDEVHAGDITLMQQRITLKTTQYPQLWNHDVTTGQPLPNAAPSLDWRFVDAHTTAKGADYQVATNYPVKNASPLGGGFWRDNVPNLLQHVPTIDASFCDQDIKNTYYGILLGDVDGSWNTTASQDLRTTAEGTLMLDLFNAEKLADGSYQIPVTYQHMVTVHAIDFSLNYDQAQLTVDQIITSRQSNEANVQMMWNNHQRQQILLTSYTVQGLGAAATAYYITVKPTNGKLNKAMFTELKGFINGRAAQVKVINTAKELNELKGLNELSVYPMPSTNGEFVVGYSQIGNITPIFTLYDLAGKSYAIGTNITETGKVKVKTYGLQTGVYLLKASNPNGQVIATKRIIIQK